MVTEEVLDCFIFSSEFVRVSDELEDYFTQ